MSARAENAAGGAAATSAGLGAIVLWAFLAPMSKRAGVLPPFELVAISFAVAGALGLAALATTGRLHEVRQKPAAWLHGVGGLFGYHALYFGALRLAPVAEANLLNYTWPLLIVLLSWPVLGLRLTARHLAGLLAGGAGAVLVLGGSARFATHGNALAGYALALLAAVTWATYSVLSRKLASVPAGALAGFCAATAVLATGAHLLFETTVVPERTTLLVAVAMGVGPVGAAFALWNIGMRQGDVRLLGTIAYAIPVASTLLLCAAGYATPTPLLLAAAVLVAAGGALAARA